MWSRAFFDACVVRGPAGCMFVLHVEAAHCCAARRQPQSTAVDYCTDYTAKTIDEHPSKPTAATSTSLLFYCNKQEQHEQRHSGNNTPRHQISDTAIHFSEFIFVESFWRLVVCVWRMEVFSS
ncbi:unnamed protein product, partial [Ectocarpus sp. 12 AP-2014]